VELGGFLTVARILESPFNFSPRHFRGRHPRSREGRVRREHRRLGKSISLFVRLLASWIERDPSLLIGLLLPIFLAICVVIIIALI
jgi:hypothetical protein